MPGTKGTKLRVGILADWGCGTAESAAVLEALRAEQPDVLIHLVCLFRQILDYALARYNMISILVFSHEICLLYRGTCTTRVLLKSSDSSC